MKYHSSQEVYTSPKKSIGRLSIHINFTGTLPYMVISQDLNRSNLQKKIFLEMVNIFRP